MSQMQEKTTESKAEEYDDLKANDCGFGCAKCIDNDICSVFCLPFVWCLSICDCKGGVSSSCGDCCCCCDNLQSNK